MSQKDFPRPKCDVWEDHYDVVMLFADNITQWRSGPIGVIGMDYTAFYRYFDRHGFSGEQEDEAMDMIRVMEAHVMSRKP